MFEGKRGLLAALGLSALFSGEAKLPEQPAKPVVSTIESGKKNEKSAQRMMVENIATPHVDGMQDSSAPLKPRVIMRRSSLQTDSGVGARYNAELKAESAKIDVAERLQNYFEGDPYLNANFSLVPAGLNKFRVIDQSGEEGEQFLDVTVKLIDGEIKLWVPEIASTDAGVEFSVMGEGGDIVDENNRSLADVLSLKKNLKAHHDLWKSGQIADKDYKEMLVDMLGYDDDQANDFVNMEKTKQKISAL